MIREKAIKEIEEWEGREIVLSLSVPGMGLRMERVFLVSISGSFLLCQDDKKRNQVYYIGNLIGWEPFDTFSKRVLEETLESVAPPKSLVHEDSGVREVAKVRTVLQKGCREI